MKIPGERKELEFHVTKVNVVKKIPITQDMLDYATKGRSGEIPQDATHALDVILRQVSRSDLKVGLFCDSSTLMFLSQAKTLDVNFETIGRSFFPRDGKILDIGFGREVWTGTFQVKNPGFGRYFLQFFNNCHFQSCRAGGWKEGGTFKRLMALNVDVSNKPALKNLHLTEETSKGKGDSYIAQVLIVNNALNRFAYHQHCIGIMGS